MPAMRLIITGRVQGVFFRAEAKRMANELGVTGWALNNPDGSVEVHAEGSTETLSQLETWCRRGPAGAHVAAMEHTEAQEEGWTEFVIQR